VFPELRSIFAKTAGLADVLREALAPLADRGLVAFVFGSAARGELRATSDIDLVIVGDVEFATVVAALAQAQEQLRRDVNPSVYPPAEFRDKLARGHHFLTAVLREPRVFIIGGDDELVRMGAKRLARQAPDEPPRDPRPAPGRRARSRRQRR
jgi:predicted nucleotidyltransferase